jgi:8-oxo-dGTP diphosphatase
MNKINLAGCVLLENHSILLLHRIKTDWYELPGGKVDAGESEEEAAVRELKEELKCDIEIVKKLGSNDFEEGGCAMSYTWFQAVIKEEQRPIVGEPDKFDEVRYIPINDLGNYKLSSNMQNFLNRLQNKTTHLTTKAINGIVAVEKSVDIATHLDANDTSPP